MPTLKIVCMGVLLISGALAQEQKKKSAKPAIPEVSALFSKSLPRVSQPVEIQDHSPLAMLVSTPDIDAAKYTWAGFSYLHAGWDVEAYRHFCQALRKDENCLIAHVGVILSLSSPYHHELGMQRNAALLRLLELVEYKVKGQFFFPAKERGFALAVAHLVTEGREVGARAFELLAKKYPKDLQIPLLAAVLGRDGYNALGRPNRGERNALESIEKIYKENPEHPLAAQYLLVMHLESPLAPDVLEAKLLPVARKLAQQGEVATWKHWLGVYEYRCGNLAKAEKAFEKAVELLEKWKKENVVGDADADALWKAYLYLATVKYERGDKAAARAIADMFLQLPVDESRLWSAGTQLILWEGYSLAVRLSLPSSLKVIPEESITKLPRNNRLKHLVGKSAALHYYEFMGTYLALRKASIKGDKKAVASLKKRLEGLENILGKVQKQTLKTGEYHSAVRFFKHARILAIESRCVGEDSAVARSLEYDQLCDKLSLPTRMLPSLVIEPYEVVYASELIGRKRYEAAKEVLESLVKRRPTSVTGWKKMLEVGEELRDEDLVNLSVKTVKELTEKGE